MFSPNKDKPSSINGDQDIHKRKKTLNVNKGNTLTVVEDIFLLCSHSGCNTKYKLNKFPPLTPVVAPMNEDEKFWAILESITQTKLFCMQHSLQHATTICENSKIVYEE